MVLVSKFGSTFLAPGGNMYTFEEDGKEHIVMTDAVAELFAMQAWDANGWNVPEAGKSLAEQAVLDQTPVQYDPMLCKNVRVIMGGNIHAVLQNAINRRRSLNGLDKV